MFIAVVLALCFCACDESKKQTTQCNDKLECDKEQCNKGDGEACMEVQRLLSMATLQLKWSG